MFHRSRCRAVLPFVVLTGATDCALAQTWTGQASYYSYRARTASGQISDPGAMTAAHRTAPFGARLKVTNLANNRTAIVTVVDRGPFIRGRVIDVSRRVAVELGFHQAGVARVRVETLAAGAAASDKTSRAPD